eukprot:3664897-Prymnesium_polylepis.1
MTWTDSAGATACETHGYCYILSVFTADAIAPVPTLMPSAGQQREQVDVRWLRNGGALLQQAADVIKARCRRQSQSGPWRAARCAARCCARCVR